MPHKRNELQTHRRQMLYQHQHRMHPRKTHLRKTTRKLRAGSNFEGD